MVPPAGLREAGAVHSPKSWIGCDATRPSKPSSFMMPERGPTWCGRKETVTSAVPLAGTTPLDGEAGGREGRGAYLYGRSCLFVILSTTSRWSYMTHVSKLKADWLNAMRGASEVPSRRTGTFWPVSRTSKASELERSSVGSSVSSPATKPFGGSGRFAGLKRNVTAREPPAGTRPMGGSMVSGSYSLAPAPPSSMEAAPPLSSVALATE